MTPRVSVIIPTHDGERWVDRTLESVFAQDHEPLEVIVCDDGSKDGTRERLQRWDGRIRLICQENRGVAAARNRAAEEATGELLAFLDQDDLWEPGMLAAQVRRLEDTPGCGLVYADSWIIDEQGTVHGRRGSFLDYREGRVFDRLLLGNFIPIETSVMPARVFRELGGFDPELHYLEDYELFLRIARHHTVACDPEPRARYRVHERNLSHDREALLAEWVTVLAKLPELVPDLDPAERAVVERQRAQRCAELAWHALRRADLPAADAWMGRAGRHCPPSWGWRVRLPRAVFGALPSGWTRRLVRHLPRGRFYGLARPTRRPTAGS